MDEVEVHEFRDAFEALFEPAKAAYLRARADAWIQLRRVIVGWPGTRAQKAKRLGISEPRYTSLMKGDTPPSLDTLAQLAGQAGLEPSLVYQTPPGSRYKAGAESRTS